MNTTSELGSQSQTNTPRELNFDFRGDGMEYFKIWIVNVLLTIVTLGIYSAWAKVRTNRYFYSNLYLDESNFRYLADPITILKGRIIAVVALLIYSYAASHYPLVGLGLAVALIIAIPYFVNQSMAFNNRMSAYKNIQFRFSATYGEAFMVLFIWPLLGVLTLGILMPMAMLKQHEYTVKNSAYGTTKFDYNASYADYGMIFLTMFGIAIMFGLPAWAIMAFAPKLAMISPVMIAVMYIGLIVFFLVKLINLFYRSLSILDHRFQATLTIPGLAVVMLINFLLTVVTLGLYLPAAKVRMMKYICANLTMQATDSLDNFSAAEQENISALGEEFGQVFDFGL